jgi:hypothetical protein
MLLAACASGPVKEIETQQFVVTKTERAITPAQVASNQPPAPLGPRPGSLPAAADTLAAKLCEWVLFGRKADAMNQHAAGMEPISRVLEPICDGK